MLLLIIVLTESFLEDGISRRLFVTSQPKAYDTFKEQLI